MSEPNIWSTARRTESRPSGSSDVRTEFEKDFDRLLFSTPVRRLADKTQVFPLERNDSVRTRLTHSHEVSNLSRSLGTRLIRTDPTVFGEDCTANESAPIILAAIGLAHDLGNPPFGHQGETAISRWVTARLSDANFLPSGESFPEEMRGDFNHFEGNAQTFRLVTRLQNTSGPAGLNLTAGTLAAMMKYSVDSSKTSDAHPGSKKHGYFLSEQEITEWVQAKTGIPAGKRHPLTWIMEAADDIAYSVLDVEDAIKKGLISPEDFLAFLRDKFSLSDLGGLTNQLAADFVQTDGRKFSLSRVREIKTTYLRTRLIERLMTGAANSYLEDKFAFLSLERKRSLLECDSDESKLCSALKEFARVHAYQSTNVLQLELKGSIVITELMDQMWSAITNRKHRSILESRRNTATDAYVYSMISDSYRWHFEKEAR